MRVVVLHETTPEEAVSACAGADAAVVVGPEAGRVAGALIGVGLRVATWTGAADDPALADMVAELFGSDAEIANLRQ